MEDVYAEEEEQEGRGVLENVDPDIKSAIKHLLRLAHSYIAHST